MQKYELGALVGEGSYGAVIKATVKETGAIVAIKRFKEGEEEHLVQKTSMREVKVLRALRDQPYVVNLIEAFRRKGRLYLVFDYVGKNVLELLEERPNGLTEPEVRRMIFTALMALHSCHVNGIIHRDIKIENLLVHAADGTLRLCDMGFARFLNSSTGNSASSSSASQQQQQQQQQQQGGGGGAGNTASSFAPCPAGHPQDLTDYVATRWYRAPELLLGTTNYGYAVDLWAIGCIMSEILDGQPLFPAETEYDQLRLICKGLGPLTDWQYEVFDRTPRFKGNQLNRGVRSERIIDRKFEGRISKAAMQTLKALLQVDPAKRPSIVQALQMPWFDGLAQQYCPAGFRLGAPYVNPQRVSSAAQRPQPQQQQQQQEGARPVSGTGGAGGGGGGAGGSGRLSKTSGPATPTGDATQQQQQQQQQLHPSSGSSYLPETSVSYYQQQLQLGGAQQQQHPHAKVPSIIGSGRSGTPEQQQQQQGHKSVVMMPDIRAPPSSVVMGATGSRMPGGGGGGGGGAPPLPMPLGTMNSRAQQQQQQQQPPQQSSPVMAMMMGAAGGGGPASASSSSGVPPRSSSGHGKNRTPTLGFSPQMMPQQQQQQPTAMMAGMMTPQQQQQQHHHHHHHQTQQQQQFVPSHHQNMLQQQQQMMSMMMPQQQQQLPGGDAKFVAQQQSFETGGMLPKIGVGAPGLTQFVNGGAPPQQQQHFNSGGRPMSRGNQGF